MARRQPRIGFVGDLMLGRGVSRRIGTRPAEDFWGDVLGSLRACDGVIGNLESPITVMRERWTKTRKMFHFRAVPAATELLSAANVRFVSLANNHIMDYGEGGAIETQDHLAAAGIAFAGFGRNAAEAVSPALCQIGKLGVGAFALTDNMPEWAAKGDRGGTHYLSIGDDLATRHKIRLLVADLRTRGADCVVLSVHWGLNFRARPPRRFRRFARAAVEEGVDVVHGHSAHRIQGIEVHRSGVILYDTGDFMSDYWVFPGIRTDRSALFLVDFDGGRPAAISAVPVSLTPAQARLARGPEFEAISECLRRRCLALGTRISSRDGAVRITVPVERPPKAGI